MFPLILKAADEPLAIDTIEAACQGQSQASAQSQDLFPYDEGLDEALSTLLATVNRDGSPEVRAAFGSFLGYVERLEKTIKQHYQHQPRHLTWVETGTITLN